MNAELLSYFAAEKYGAVILLGMGLTSLLGSYALWQSKSTFLAMIWPLLILGAFEIIIGATVALRTSDQVQKLEAGFASDKLATVSLELVRMERVNRNFKIVKIVEVVLIGVGLLALYLFPVGATWYAVGLGLILQGGALLVFDAFAHHRGEVYLHWLQNI
ncbi:MAG: hypothetical protein AAF387_01265 [Pseudomonadota bacterium]